MKNLLFIFIILATIMVSCTNTIDKKIVITEYKEVIEKVKKENTEYSEKDFEKAKELFDGVAFSVVSKGETKSDKTYRQLLGEARLDNEREQKIIDDYNNEMDAMLSKIKLELLESEYIEGKLNNRMYRTFVAGIEFTNKSDKNITGLKGKFLIKNPNNEVIKTCFVEFASVENPLLPEQPRRDAREYPIVENYDNVLELNAVSSEHYKTDWEPSFIIFDDGTKIVAPTKPYILSKK